jgi:hypothetical protein
LAVSLAVLSLSAAYETQRTSDITDFEPPAIYAAAMPKSVFGGASDKSRSFNVDARFSTGVGLFNCKPVLVTLEYGDGTSPFEVVKAAEANPKENLTPFHFAVQLFGVDRPRRIEASALANVISRSTSKKTTYASPLNIPPSVVRQQDEGDSTILYFTFAPSKEQLMQDEHVRNQLRRATKGNSSEGTPGLKMLYAVVRVSFTVDFAIRRGLGSCYLPLPSIIPGRNHADEYVLPYDPIFLEKPDSGHVGALDVDNGKVQVAVSEGTLIPDPRTPLPAEASNNSWRCRSVSYEGYILDDTRDSSFDCRALMTLSKAQADNTKAFTVFLAAAIFSLALQMAYDALRH